MKPDPNRERERPQTFLPSSTIEQQMARARTALGDLEQRVETLEVRQALARLGSEGTLFLDPEPGPAERANGHDRPETETERNL